MPPRMEFCVDPLAKSSQCSGRKGPGARKTWEWHTGLSLTGIGAGRNVSASYFGYFFFLA
jgi:hypothetical protein